MSLKAIIHKATVQFSDLDRNIYSDHSLTIARHPSETDERMMIRLLAFVLNAPPNNDQGTLEFAKDMWEADEPCLWQKDLTGLLVHWIDIGQPDEKRIIRACGKARCVSVYTFSSATPTWWSGVAAKLSRASNLTVWQIPAAQSQQLAALADKSMDLQVTIQDGELSVSAGITTVVITPTALQGGE